MARRFTARSGYPLRDTFTQSQALRARHGRFAKPLPPDDLERESRIRMRHAKDKAAAAGLPRPPWTFRASEVATFDFDGNGQLLFRLHDGRVFDDEGNPRLRDR